MTILYLKYHYYPKEYKKLWVRMKFEIAKYLYDRLDGHIYLLCCPPTLSKPKQSYSIAFLYLLVTNFHHHIIQYDSIYMTILCTFIIAWHLSYSKSHFTYNIEVPDNDHNIL